MNSAVYGRFGEPVLRGNRRFLAGVGVSIALHVLLMFAYRHAGPVVPAFAPEPPASIAIRILPPAPPPQQPRVAEAAEVAEVARAEPAAPRRASKVRQSVPKSVIAVPASPQQESPPDGFAVQAAEEPPAEGEAPEFDLNAARQTARQLAGQTKLGREGTLAERMPDPPLETESKFAKAISKAKRRNCKDGLPGGLLAPLFLMMDKKDSGCKW